MSLLATIKKKVAPVTSKVNKGRQGLASIGMKVSNSIGATRGGQGLKSTVSSAVPAFKAGVGQFKAGATQYNTPNASPLQKAEGALKMGAGAVNAVASPFAEAAKPVSNAFTKGTDRLADTKFFKSVAGNQVAAPGGSTSYQPTNTGTLERGLEAASNAGVIAGASSPTGLSRPSPLRATPKTFAEKFASASNKSEGQVGRNLGEPTGGTPQGNYTVSPASKTSIPSSDAPLKSGSQLQGDMPSATRPTQRGDIDMRQKTTEARNSTRLDTSSSPTISTTVKNTAKVADEAVPSSAVPKPKSPILKYGIPAVGAAAVYNAFKGGDEANTMPEVGLPMPGAEAGAEDLNDPFEGQDPFEGGAFEAPGAAPQNGMNTGGSLSAFSFGGSTSGGAGGGSSFMDSLGMGAGGSGSAYDSYIGDDEEEKDKYGDIGENGRERKYRYENVERDAEMEAERNARRAENEMWGGKENKKRAQLLEKQERDMNNQIMDLLNRQAQGELGIEESSASASARQGNSMSLDRETRRSLTPLNTSLGLIQSELGRRQKQYDTNYSNRQEDQSKYYTVGEGQMLYDNEGRLIAQGNAKQPTEKSDPASIQEYEYARKNGYQGSFTDFKALNDASTNNLDKVLSPTEAAALGVPYGTTQSQAYGQNPSKLSGDAAKVQAIASTMIPEINALKQRFTENYKGALTGFLTGTDRELVKLIDQVADKVGRLRSGGAVNADEETRFKRQIASFMDLPFGNSQQAIDALDGLINEAQQVSSSIDPYYQGSNMSTGGGSGWNW